MAEDNTGYTSPMEDNLLGITTSVEIDREEATGVARAERLLLNLEENIEINTSLMLQIHKLVFGRLYSWAGKWRSKQVKVGHFLPPEFHQIPNLMYQFIDELNYRIKRSSVEEELVKTLAYCQHRIVYIHPFDNGNGRTARLITNLVAFKHGYDEINIYHRTGERRDVYIKAIRNCDKGDFMALEDLIRKELTRL
jgi:cell filamentation protein